MRSARPTCTTSLPYIPPLTQRGRSFSNDCSETRPHMVRQHVTGGQFVVTSKGSVRCSQMQPQGDRPSSLADTGRSEGIDELDSPQERYGSGANLRRDRGPMDVIRNNHREI